MEHALPRRFWTLCMTSENHGAVGPAGCTFSHAPEKHERVLVVEAPAGARAPVAELKGYVDGEPAVTWFDRDNMPRVGTKLFVGPVAAQTSEAAVPDEQLEWSHDLQERLITASQDFAEHESVRQVMAEAACLLAALTGVRAAPTSGERQEGGSRG
jgi:hypothetical protein